MSDQDFDRRNFLKGAVVGGAAAAAGTVAVTPSAEAQAQPAAAPDCGRASPAMRSSISKRRLSSRRWSIT